MSTKLNLEKKAKLKKQSRAIVKEIVEFGVTDDQKVDIMYLLSLTLESHDTSQQLAKFIKKFNSSLSSEENKKSNILT